MMKDFKRYTSTKNGILKERSKSRGKPHSIYVHIEIQYHVNQSTSNIEKREIRRRRNREYFVGSDAHP